MTRSLRILLAALAGVSLTTRAFAADAPAKPVEKPAGSVPAAKVAEAPAKPTAEPAEPKATLKVGDPAPALAISKFVKGEPVKELEKGKVYVVEFWATWCGPCIAVMPHLSELQKTYGDKVTVLSVNIWERSMADLEKIPDFVKERGDAMSYRVCVDTYTEKNGRPTSTMSESWMRAAGRNGIPSAFIVGKDQKIAWMGHPMKMDAPLAKIVEGTYDPAAQAAIDEKIESLQKDAFAAARAKEYDKAIGLLDEINKADPTSAASTDLTRLQWTYLKGDYAAGNALAKKITSAKNDAQTAQRVSMVMLTIGDVEQVDKDLALELTTRGVESLRSNPKTAWAADMYLARAHFARKEYPRAIELQKKAMESADERAKTMLERDLKKYEEAAAQK